MSKLPDTVFIVFNRRNSGGSWHVWGTYPTKGEARDAEREAKSTQIMQAKTREFVRPGAPAEPRVPVFVIGGEYSIQGDNWPAPVNVEIFDVGETFVRFRRTARGAPSVLYTMGEFERAYARAREDS